MDPAHGRLANTTAPGIILVVNKAKRKKGQILLVNASKQCAKGRPKNFLEDSQVDAIGEAYLKWNMAEGLSAIIATQDAIKNDYNLSPSRYVSVGEKEDVLPLDEAVVLLREAEEEREAADRGLTEVLRRLGLDG